MGVTLVTGGTGYVGRYVVSALARQGDTVISYNRDFTTSDDAAVIAVQGELFDIPRMVGIFEHHGVQRVIHTAAMSHPELSIDLPVTTFAANVDGTLKLFEAARIAGVARIVNFSSECAYGHQEGTVAEGNLPLPNTPYGVTKVATELLGRVYGELYGIDVVSLRVTEVYGPGNRMPEVLKEMIQAALAGRPYELDPGGDHRFHFVHAEDVTQAALAAAGCSGGHAPVYNVSGGRQVTLKEAAEIIRSVVPGASIRLGDGHLPNWDRQGPFDLSASERDLGYRPRWGLEDGIASYADWLRDHAY